MIESRTVKQRFTRAMNVLRSEGIAARRNVRKCCRSCITPEDLGMARGDQPYAYTYGGQGHAIAFAADGGVYYPSDGTRAERAWFNHGNGAAERVVEAFRAEGFAVEWSGSDSDCVEVILA